MKRVFLAALTLTTSLILFVGLGGASASRPASSGTGTAVAPSHGPSSAGIVRHHDAVVHAQRVHHAAELRTAATLRRRAYLVNLWTPVAVCEEGGWIGYASPQFPDSIGQDAQNWYQNGGGSDLRPFVQAEEGMRFLDRWHTSIPDRQGCSAY